MAETQKPGRPNEQKPDQWQQDLNPDPMAGQNVGMESFASEKESPTAYDIKALHKHLKDFTDDELKHIIVLPQGTRLKQGATYIDLMNPEWQEFTAMGDMEATADHCYVPKTEISYPLWNRLTGIENPERLDEPTRK